MTFGRLYEYIDSTLNEFPDPVKIDMWSPPDSIKRVYKPNPSNLLLSLLERINHGN